MNYFNLENLEIDITKTKLIYSALFHVDFISWDNRKFNKIKPIMDQVVKEYPEIFGFIKKPKGER